MLGTITLTVVEEEEASTQIKGPAENIEDVSSEATLKSEIKEQGQDEAPEATNATLESPEESPDQTNETQSSEVGFKKVFNFVGFKFTVKKDKTEKSEPVQLLTVKQEKVEVNGTENHEKQNDGSDENVLETEDTKEVEKQSETDPIIQTETQEEVSAEKPKSEEETKLEKEQVKTPESPTNPLVVETSSPLKKFFTQGWAGLRKKTSFRKSKEEDHQEVEKHILSEEQENVDSQQAKEAALENQIIVNGETLPKEANEIEESKACINKETQPNTNELAKPEECLADQPLDSKADIKLDNANISEVSITEGIQNFVVVDNAVPVPNEVNEQLKESDTADDKDVNQVTMVSTSTAIAEEVKETLSEMAPDTEITCDKDDKDTHIEQAQSAANTESKEAETCQEPIMTETELLSSQEKAKLQGSPLKKLFSGNGLRKLSGKKHKGKKEDDTKTEYTTEVPVSSDIPEGDGDNTSPSSPEESAETSPTENGPEDVPQTVETEGDGATSDGERKIEGITPWASFKKLVTPKRRPKRPSESDKEEEVEKIKTSTMSSTDSTGSVENQEEAKENGEEQKLEKSTEENKKKVDNSVSWEALICVGSAKKRARKTSDSDEEETQKNIEENKKIEEEVNKSKEQESEDPIVSSQENEQVYDSPSPDQSTSPVEGEGGSTWQSFKRLVNPRRKSRTRAEEKTEETSVVSNNEQPTSDGETGKEEGWVSFKKLIPGRKKKKSDGKQEQATISDTGKSTEGCEAMDDDADVPAVVPLSEFDAAEQEKREAQQAEDALNDVSKDELKTPEATSEGLIHAITVTVVEGERAVTSLEDRAPSWISANVTETIEQANELTEPNTNQRIKSEITVEEAVIFGEVSQMAGNTIINEVELTSEALTALAEAIEYSCAEQTTEMISAASQLSDSFTPTEEVTLIPEEDEGSQILDVPEKKTDSVLNSATELAEQSLVEKPNQETICTSAEEHGLEVDEKNICISSKQDEESTIFSAKQIEECTLVLAERPGSSEIKSVIENNGADSVSVVEQINKIAVIETAKEKSSDKADIDAPVDTKEYPTDATVLEEKKQETSVGSAEVQACERIVVLEESHADTIADTAVKQDESILVLSEKKVEECAIRTPDHETASVPAKCQFEEVTPFSTENNAPPIKEPVLDDSISAVEHVDVASERTVEESTPTLEQEQLNELSEQQSSISVSTVHKEQVKDVALISDEQEIIEHPHVSDDLEPKEGAGEQQLEEKSIIYEKVTENAPIFAEEKETECSFVLTETTQATESVCILEEELARDSDPEELLEQANAIAKSALNESDKHSVEDASNEVEKQVSECSTVMLDELVAKSPTSVAATLTAEIASIVEQSAERHHTVKEEQKAEYLHSEAETQISEISFSMAKDETMEVTTAAEHDKESTPGEKQAVESFSVSIGEQEAESLNTAVEEQDLESAIEEQVTESATTATEEQRECAPNVDDAHVVECNAITVEEPSEEITSATSVENTAEMLSVSLECPITTKEVQATEIDILIADEQVAEGVLIAAEEHVTESVVDVAGEKTEESAITLAKESGETVAFEEHATESVVDAAGEKTEESAITLAKESGETVAFEEHATESVVDAAGEKTEESAITLAKESGETVAFEEHATESVVDAAGEKTEESAITLAKESGETVAFEEYDAESAPSLAKDQAGESALTATEGQIESICAAALGQANETVIFDSEVQIAAAVDEKHFAESVTAEAKEQATLSVDEQSAEVQIAEGIDLTTVEDIAESAVFAVEEVTAKSVISVAEESISTAVEDSPTAVAKGQTEESVTDVAVEYINEIITTATAEEQIEENLSVGEQSVEVTASLVEKTAGENVYAAFQEEATESATIVDSEPCAENVISTNGGLTTDIATPTTQEQVSQDFNTGFEEQIEQNAVSFTETLTAESVANEETATEFTAAPVEGQVVGILNTVVDEQAGKTDTTLTEVQAVEITANDLTGESAPAEVEVHVIDCASEETEEQSSDMEQRVDNDSASAPEKDVYTSPVVTENVATVLEEYTDESEVLTFNANVDVPCSVDLNDVEQQEKNVVMTVEKTPEEIVDDQVPHIVSETIPMVSEEHGMERVTVNISEQLTLDCVVLEGNLESIVPQDEVTVCEQETVPEPTIYSMPVEQQSATVPEDTVTEVTNIPEFESSEATKTSETVTTAAVQEQILTETVMPIETSTDTKEACETPKYADDLSETSGAVHTVAQSVSQKAAAIVDAAIEAAASCLVVKAATHESTLEENIPENGVFIQESISVCTDANEDNLVQTTIISSFSTVSVQKFTETSVEKIEEIVEEIHTGESVDHKHSLKAEETEPVSAQFAEEVATAEEKQDIQETSKPIAVAIATGLHDGCVVQEEDKEHTPVHMHEESLKAAGCECTEQVTLQITHTESESSMSINKPIEEEIVSQDSAELNTQADSQTVES
ncbi:A-kinase anchor protein 12 isoform X2 [Xenopus laevis]|uniref:A-kinase anchor protein 12 isoform X2 n=1 Tax=Xenopus laevis TaxID=8355 RepID=A0A8J1KSP7_XENLA|nr:A-kinase anchor protein 12 isoform X2 [Xenopus laevis]